MAIKDLVVATRKTIVDSVDTIADLIDTGVEAATDSELLDTIPFVGTGVKILKAKDQYQEHRFRRNCVALLSACASADHIERERLFEQLSKTPEVLDDFADTLLLITADSSKPSKAKVVGNLVAALCKEEITYEEYDALAHIVHSASIPALQAVVSYCRFKQVGSHLANEPLLISLGIGIVIRQGFVVTRLGEHLYNYGMRDEDDPFWFETTKY